MRRTLILAVSLGLAAIAFAPTSTADACVVVNDTPPLGLGGVTGMTYTYAADVGNAGLGQACNPPTTAGGAYAFADHVADLTCQYLVGLDCL